MYDHLRENRIAFIDLNQDDVADVRLRSRFTGLESLALPVELLQSDFIVSMPKLKTHHWAGMTASMKNLFGTVPGAVYGWPKNILHRHGIDNSIVDLTATIRPHFAIVDAVVGMEGDGPIMGRPRQLGCVIMGSDLVAVDATSARMIGLDPTRIEYLSEAGRFLGQISTHAGSTCAARRWRDSPPSSTSSITSSRSASAVGSRADDRIAHDRFMRRARAVGSWPGPDIPRPHARVRPRRWPLPPMLLIGLTILLLAGLATPPDPRGIPTEMPPGQSDSALFRAVAARMADGEAYYPAMGDELVARGYPTGSVANWRTPLYLELVAHAPGALRALLLLVAVLVLGGTALALRPVSTAPWWRACCCKTG